MGGPGSGRRPGGRGGAKIGTKIGIKTAKTAAILANRSGMTKISAKLIMAKNKQLAKREAKRKAKKG